MCAESVRVVKRLEKKRRGDAAGEILLLLALLKEEANGEARALHSQAEQSGRGLGHRTGLNGTGSPVAHPAESSPPAASLSLYLYVSRG